MLDIYIRYCVKLMYLREIEPSRASSLSRDHQQQNGQRAADTPYLHVQWYGTATNRRKHQTSIEKYNIKYHKETALKLANKFLNCLCKYSWSPSSEVVAVLIFGFKHRLDSWGAFRSYLKTEMGLYYRSDNYKMLIYQGSYFKAQVSRGWVLIGWDDEPCDH